MDLNSTDKKELRSFGIVLGLVLLFIGFLHFRRGHTAVSYYLFAFGGAFEIISIMAPNLIKPVYKILTPVLKAIGWFNTRLLLSIVFYLIIAPIGIIMRLGGNDRLFRRLDKNARSYWVLRDGNAFDPKHYEKQF